VLNLKTKYDLYDGLVIGAALGYLFADRDFQAKDAKQMQT